MRVLGLIYLLVSFFNAQAQCETLQFTELGSAPAYCRTASYQSGNGVVYAAVSGGTPDYTYVWTNLYNGLEVQNSVLGGVNPGEYEIVVTDDAGCVISAVVKVDSINPQADFIVSEIEPNETGTGIWVEFTNTSDDLLNTAWPAYPDQDTNYRWTHDNFTSSTSLTFNENYLAEISSPGYFKVCLISTNYNFCTDTLCELITVTDEFDECNQFVVNYSSLSGEVNITSEYPQPVHLFLMPLNGGFSQEIVIYPGINLFTLDSGIYGYELVNNADIQSLCSGSIAIY